MRIFVFLGILAVITVTSWSAALARKSCHDDFLSCSTGATPEHVRDCQARYDEALSTHKWHETKHGVFHEYDCL